MRNDPARQIAKSARTFEDPAERAAYLDRVCRGIARLRADVERHLAEMETRGADAEEAAGGGASDAGGEPGSSDSDRAVTATGGAGPDTPDTPDGPRPGADAAAPESLGNEKPGDRIGRYVLRSELGEGGFGTVWKAEQVEPVRREVALKIIKLGMDTGQVVARFEQERQALALMDHPNVARVLDAGATKLGRPYFVMDLVRGVPIGEFCDAERLSVEARLLLFSQVCAAVQHAHMKGIIHRDLKPSNILVSMRDGEPHATVIDFGIAKATSARLTDRSLVTEAYQVIGTLQYMSPEQSQASPDIDTRTDVFSLGVILYELLTGVTPYDGDTFARAVLSDILRMISEADAPPPSAKVSQSGNRLPDVAGTRSVDARRLVTKLRGELDWIVLKAIEKDRARRYDSPEALAADLRRFLAGEEVVAAPPSATYRLRKFVRRNRGAVAAASAVAASLVAGIVAFAWQAGVASDERDDAVAARKTAEAERRTAEVERRRSESVATLMETVFEGINPDEEKGGAASLRDQIVAKLDSVAGEFARLEGDPLGRARLQMALGGPLSSLGEYEKALDAYRDAFELRSAHLGEAAPETVRTSLAIVAVLRFLGRHDESLRAAQGARERLLAAGPLSDEQANDVDLSTALTHQAAGRHEDAIALLEAVHQRFEKAGGPPTRERLFALQALGAVYREAHRVEDAVRVLTDTHARRAALLGDDHPDTVFTANSVAVALASAGRIEDALRIQEGVCRSMERRYAPDHPDAMSAHANLAGFMVAAGRADEAVKLMEALAARAVARYGDGTATAVHTQYALARLYFQAKRYADAASAFERIMTPMTRIWGADHGVVSTGWRDYATACGRLEDLPRAVRSMAAETARLEADASLGGPDGKAALRLRVETLKVRLDLGEPVAAEIAAIVPRVEKAHGPLSRLTLEAVHQAGRAFFEPETAKTAVEWLERAHARRTEAFGPDDPETMESQHSLGASCWLARDYPRAVAILEDALRRAERVLGPDAPSTLTTALDLATNYDAAGRKTEYLELLSVWLPRAQVKLGMEHPHVAGTVEAFIPAAKAEDRLDLAAPVLQAACDAAAAALGPDDPQLLHMRANAASCWFQAGRVDRALPAFEDILPRLERVLGPDDSFTLLTTANLAINLREGGRHAESVALLEKLLRSGADMANRAAGDPEFVRRAYLMALAAAGKAAETRALAAEMEQAARKRSRAGSTGLATELAGLAVSLLDAKLWDDAETLLREVIEIRTKAAPDLWGTHNARALLGEALLGRRRFAEAEPLVTAGCEALLRPGLSVPGRSRSWIAKAKDRVLRLYTEWEAAEPGSGAAEKLVAWKAKFGAAPSSK